MNIGILGTRGVPNYYSGYERLAEYLSVGLLHRGHQVGVYCSTLHPNQDPEWKGVKRIIHKDPEDKLGSFGQFIYDFNCLQDARQRDFDVLLQLGYTSNAVWYWIWPRKMIQILHMDGLEWKRSKYSKGVRRFLRKSEKWAATHADALIADSPEIANHLWQSYQKSSFEIAYGAEIPTHYDTSALDPYQLKPGRYFLLIARMVPENNIETIIKGYLQSGSNLPLVIVGNTNTRSGSEWKRTYGGENIRFTEGIFEIPIIDSLRHYCALYFHGHSVGGTNPSLLEAMAAEALIAAHDNPFNRAVLGEHAAYFSKVEEVAQWIHSFKKLPQADWKKANLEKIRTVYTWERVVDAYEEMMLKCIE